MILLLWVYTICSLITLGLSIFACHKEPIIEDDEVEGSLILILMGAFWPLTWLVNVVMLVRKLVAPKV